MGKKPQRIDWAEAIKRCRLSPDDVVMAKRLGFQPDKLVGAVPSLKQSWKLPVHLWVRELHLERFGHVIGEQTPPPIQPEPFDLSPEEARAFEEEVYWEDYWDRNSGDQPQEAKPPRSARFRKRAPAAMAELPKVPSSRGVTITDDDVPF